MTLAEKLKAEGKLEGKLKGKIEVVQHMLSIGIEIALIAKYTGIPLAQLNDWLNPKSA